jgi:lysophospholipase L1-like esterase
MNSIAISAAKTLERRSIFRCFLFVSLCAFSWLSDSEGFAQSLKSPAAVAKKPTGPARFESEIEAFEKWDRQNAVPRDAILFVGSSSIRLWQTAKSFPNLPVINRGFGGSTIADANHFADRIVFKYKPRTIVFYAGDNDIAGGKSPDKVFSDFQSFAKMVDERLPDTQLIYLSIKPSPSRWKLWPQSQTVNARIKELAARSKRLTYIDVGTPLLGADGQPRKELFRDDLLHMNPGGYAIWNKILLPQLSAPASSR